MNIKGKSAIVIGAGIGGLAAARALAAQGAQVSVLEQADALRAFGAGLQISPNGARVVQALGLGAELRDAAMRCKAVVLRDYSKGAEVLRLDLMRHAADLDFRLMHRADLIALLADGLAGQGIELRLGAQVRKVEPGARPALHLADGAVLTADLIVGADGLHSVLRPVLNGRDAPFFTGQVAWRAVVPNPGLPPQAQVFMGPGRHLVCYPLREGRMANIVAVQERAAWAAEGWNQPDDPDNLRAAFRDFGGDAQDLLSAVSQTHLWGLFRHPVADNWSGEGVALVGDAAHPTLPFLAQGANLALEDAWALATCWDGTDAGLDRYQMARRTRAARVIEAANRNAWRYHLRQPVVRRAAHAILRLGGRLAPSRVVGQFDWLYRYDVTAQKAA